MRNLHVPQRVIVSRTLWAIMLCVLFLAQHAQPASAASTVGTANAASGVPVLRTFEDLPAGQPVFNQYDGVTFLTGDASSHPITVFQPTVATASPTHALQDVIVSTCEFTCAIQMTMQFDTPQYRVSLSTGLAITVGVPLTMLLQGFASDPRVSGAPLVAQSAAPCLGSGPTPITTPLTITDSTTRIRYAVLSVVACSTPTNPFTFGTSNGTIVLDNLLYNRPLHPPAREHNPPVITITSPTNGSLVQGTTPGSISTNVLATVQEQNGLMSMTAQVNGHAAVPMNYWSNGAGSFDAGITLYESSGLIEGMNTVVVTAVDFDRPPNTSTASVSFTFKKRVPLPPSQVDIIPTAFEVTQTIDYGPQNNWDPSVNGFVDRFVPDPSAPPLITGKPTLIRIYAAASGTTTPLRNVPATFFVVRDHCTSNCALPGGEGILAPMSGWTRSYPGGTPIPNTRGITVPPFGTADSTPVNAAPDLRKTWDFFLPADWTQSDLVVTIDINAGNYSTLPHATPVPECTSNTAGTCNHNNEVELHLRFLPAPTIFVNVIIFHVTGTYNGQSYNDVQPSMEQVDKIFAGLNELYPLHVIMNGHSDITVSPAISKDDLLDQVGVCPKFIEACPQTNLRVGIFPADQSLPGPDEFAANEFDPKTQVFTAGYARVGGTGAWADADNPTDVAHELAHNIGFDHWACENGVTDDECGVFPIPHGGTGVYGTDLLGVFARGSGFWGVLPPGDDSANTTPHAHDLMSYGAICEAHGGGPGCNLGDWVSWYDYNILLTHFTAASYDTDDPQALLVSGRISANGIASFHPAYQVNVSQPITDTIVEDDPNDIYTMQGYDSIGNTLFVHNFEPTKLNVHSDDYGKVFDFEEAVPAMPNLQRIEVLHGPDLLGTLTNPALGQGPSVSILEPTSGSVWPVGKQQTIRWTSSSPAGVPLFALVEYSIDGGTTRFFLGRDIPGTSLTINPDELPGSMHAMIYVQVSDGINTATAAAGPFTVEPKGPSVHIITPQADSQVVASMPVTLEGTAIDPQETLSDSQFQWSSDRDGMLGTGKALTVSKLSPGHHTLTLTVTDSRGRVGRERVQIDVIPFGGSQPPPIDWRIFVAIAIALLLLMLVIAILLLRRRSRTGNQGASSSP